MTDFLSESVAAAPVKKGNRWLVTVAVPGKGTSGEYEAEMLREFGPVAFPAKTKAYFGHNLPEHRDPRDQLGTYPEGAFWNEGEQKLQAYLEPKPNWSEFVEAMGEDLELSMYALDWDRDDYGKVTRIGHHRGNTIDAVAFGGLEGSRVEGKMLESLVESARAGYTEKPGATSAQDKEKESKLTEKLEQEIAAVKALVEELRADKAEKVQAEASAEVIKAAVSESLEAYDAARKLVDEADLLDSQREAILEAAKAGQDVKPLIESARKILDEAKVALTESADSGRDLSSKKYESAVDLGKVLG